MSPVELRARREALGISQAALGSALAVKQQAISRWESGERAIPDGVDSEVSALEATADQLIDDATTAIEAAAAAGEPDVVLWAWNSDTEFWSAHPEMDGTPAALHRVAMAHARREAAVPDEFRIDLEVWPD